MLEVQKQGPAARKALPSCASHGMPLNTARRRALEASACCSAWLLHLGSQSSA